MRFDSLQFRSPAAITSISAASTMATFNQWNNPLKICPYNPNHRVSASKFAGHLVKCQAKPELPSLMECPFNAEHRVSVAEYANHIEMCPNLIHSHPMEMEAIALNNPGAQQKKQTPKKSTNDECWDND